MGKQILHISKIHELAMRNDSYGERVPFDIRFIKLSTGEIVEGRVICTSKYYKNRTLNLKWIESDQFRTIRTISIIAFNGIEIYV